MIDHEKVKEAVKMFLIAIGEDPNREGLQETPDRVSRMCSELFSGLDASASIHLKRVFPSDRPGLIVEKGIRFYSVCEHHLLPFFGNVSIAYYYHDKVVGLSKLARTVEVFARRPQIQENMTTQIANAVMNELSPDGVMVVTSAKHMCMSMRGVKNTTAETVTVAATGCFENDIALQNYVLNLINMKSE